jgi:hypothetical protein
MDLGNGVELAPQVRATDGVDVTEVAPWSSSPDSA